MKRFIALVLVLVCLFSLGGCANDRITEKDVEGTTENDTIKGTESNCRSEWIAMVMVDGVLYLDTGYESTVEARCGVMDGEIDSMVDESEEPTVNNQSNFGTGFGYQYGPREGTIEIYKDGKWQVFATEEVRQELQSEYALICDSEVGEITMDFAVRLFQQSVESDMEKENGNVLISPISIFTVLAMTANGAEGQTLTQMEEVLGMSREAINAYMKSYLESLELDETNKLHMGNSIWIRKYDGLKVKEDFIQTNQENYGAGVYEAAFDDTTCEEINQWVEEETGGMIPEIISEIPSDTVMYLINALAFEAEWEHIYNKSDVRDGIFTLESGLEQDVEMMYSEENAYLEDAYATGFMKYYKGREYAFAALLPKEGVSLQQYVSSLTGAHVSEMISNPTDVAVNVFMPKFEVEYQTEMQDVLKEMGMTDVFDSSESNLSTMASCTDGNLYAGRVLHKTFLTVDEQGTRAGAATAVEMLQSALFEVRHVYLNRPFVYMIIDCENQQPIFMGIVQQVLSDELCSYPLAE